MELRKHSKLTPPEIKIPDLDFSPPPALVKAVDKVVASACEIQSTIRRLQQDAAFLNCLTSALSDGMIRVNREGFIFEINQAACNLLGTKPEVILGKKMDSILYTNWQSFLDAYKGGTFEHTAYTLDRMPILVSTSISKVHDDEYLLLVRDIEQRVKNEADIKMLAAALNQSTDAIMVTNKENKLVFVNKSFVDYTGYTQEECIGKDPKFLSSGKTPKAVYDAMWNALRTRRPWEGAVFNKAKNGTITRDFMTITPVMNGDPNKPAFYIAVKRLEWSKKYEKPDAE